ncbi:dual specificity protein phosphatase family protein [Thalassotalea sp. Y01]|uniref:phosphatase domain-containing putative toxin n=1 Tax=Thalassotalea sp. Y01 TaxID=2729613 RepID=UPI00145FA31B|nr:dual specificity protein phosphatase family protein [Thalassotalea sp. Y01]NMP16245.1 protein phosphatase [Thalassotalea sp. Y01]
MTDKHPYDVMPLTDNGEFIFTPCPGTKATTLQDAISTLKQAGTEMIISTNYDEELQRLDVADLGEQVTAAGIRWHQLPIKDDAAPNQDFRIAFAAAINDIIAVLANNGTIAVHCKGGSGRTGLVIALIMKQLGYADQTIIRSVQELRPKALKNAEQLDFFEKFSL